MSFANESDMDDAAKKARNRFLQRMIKVCPCTSGNSISSGLISNALTVAVQELADLEKTISFWEPSIYSI